jgi:hypothetical protein
VRYKNLGKKERKKKTIISRLNLPAHAPFAAMVKRELKPLSELIYWRRSKVPPLILANSTDERIIYCKAYTIDIVNKYI